MGERRGACMALVENPEGRRPPERPRLRWEGILKCIFEKWKRGVWTDLKWLKTDRWRTVVNVVMNLQVL
jgi:hypothetical protein